MKLTIGGRLDEGGARGLATTVFVTDATPEAEAVSHALRAAGHTVVDVPASMLVARVGVQRPQVVVIDADAEGALETVERMRELPETEDIHVLYLGRAGGVIVSPEQALAREGSGLFVRPVDVRSVVQTVNALTGSASQAAPLRTTSAAPPCAPSLPPASMRASLCPPAPEAQSSAPPSPRPSKHPSEPPTSLGSSIGSSPGGSMTGSVASSARRMMGLAPPVSPELRQLLAEAEQRAHVYVEHESIVPSPEDEIEAVLPADLLAALDEPLDEDDDDDDPLAAARLPASLGPRERAAPKTTSRAPRASSTGGMTTTGSAARGGIAARPSDTPAAPPTHGGTHAGTTGDEISTTGGAESDALIERAVRPSSIPPRPVAPVAAKAPAAGAPPPSIDVSLPVFLGPGQAMRAIARAIAARTTASLCVASPQDAMSFPSAAAAARGQPSVERRIVLREGDVVTTSSTADDESLLAFLGVRGDLPRETVRRLGSKFPPHGRHAGAALVARGYVRQDQMWPTLRAHAEWLFARTLQTAGGRLIVEPQPPGRLGGEPSVFGGSTGAAVFVEIVRRIVPPAEAIERMGGIGARVAAGGEARLLGECALDVAEADQVQAAAGRSVAELLETTQDGDLATVIFALSELGVVQIVRHAGERPGGRDEHSSPDLSALDAEAVRERVRARAQLVDDGDYFALLGVARDATGYEVRRAFLELRRAFEPSRVLTPEVSDLADDVRKITVVLEEAYEILKDAARRERYRRAIEAVPEG